MGAGQQEEADHQHDQGARGLGVGDHPGGREMHRVDDDVGEQGGDRDRDQRPDRLAALAALGAQKGALGLRILETP